MSESCLDCKFSVWLRTAGGRLHPSGDGRCTWSMPVIRLPKAKYFLNNPAPIGGHIDRRKPHLDCDAWEPSSP